MDADLALRVALRRGTFALDVELDAPPGVTVLFGPSGAGKSTVLDVVAGLLEPDQGRVSLGGRVLFDAATRVRVPARERAVGYVFQSLALFPHRSVLDNVTYGLAALGATDRAARARALLERVGVAALADRAPGTLSGGERQRVALARALAPEPRVLLLDEPFAALDRPRRRDLLDLLRALVAERAVPALYVTHDQEEAEALGDRVVVLDGGRVVARGAPLDVLAAPTRWSVAALDRADNRLDATVVAQRDHDGALCVRAGAVTLLTRPADAPAGAAVVVALRAAEVIVALDPPGRTSAANVLEGTVRVVTSVGRAVVVEIDCGLVLRAEVTPAACERLALGPGVRVWAICKALSCHVLRKTDPPA